MWQIRYFLISRRAVSQMLFLNSFYQVNIRLTGPLGEDEKLRWWQRAASNNVQYLASQAGHWGVRLLDESPERHLQLPPVG